jgi:hypothetical protein
MKFFFRKSNIRDFSIVCLFLFCFCMPSAGQNRKDSIPISKNTLYVEFFGNCIYGSINYDRIVMHKNKNKVSLRFGFLPYPKVTSLASATAEVSYLYGVKHNIESSIGVVYIHGLFLQEQTSYYEHLATGNLFLYPYLGYRFQKPEGGLFLRAGISAKVNLGELYRYNYKEYGGGFEIVNSGIWFGVAIGYTFKSSKK